MRWLLVVAWIAACGGREVPRIDLDGGDPDSSAPPPSYPACSEFDTQRLIVPAHASGTLAGADLESPSGCSVTDAPYGADSAGPDRVIPLAGLRAGATYVVKLTSTSDLQFYVTTGCSTAKGPAADQCVLFEDASLDGNELGRFVAGGSTAFVVVDYFASHEPPSSDFTLDVYAEECQDSSACGSATPACSDGRCVECVSSFDCATAGAPRCDLSSHTCQAGVDACDTDDGAEPDDDGPSGARVLVLDGTGHASAAGSICSSPTTEADFVAFDVTSLGDTWDFQLAWSGGRDLDLQIFDARGTPLALSFWEQPERARLTFLPLGRYFIKIDELAGQAAAVSYTLLAHRTPGAACTGSADCAGEFRNQLYRGFCDGGACVSIQGNGGVAEGGACDSQSDCGLALSCPSFFFVSGADTRDTCSRSCGDDTDCAPLGGDFVCTSYLANNFCFRKCTADDQCPTAPGSPPGSGPWYRLTCDPPTGHCLP